MKIIRPVSALVHSSYRVGMTAYLDVLLPYNCPARAHRAVRRMKSLEREGTVQVACWQPVSLGSLACSRHFEVTAADASSADLVLVAIDPARPLPDGWDRWFWRWAQFRRKKGGSLFVVGDGITAEEEWLQEYMEVVAKIGGLAFETEWDREPAVSAPARRLPEAG